MSCPTQASKGISWREWFKGYCNKLLSTTSSWCFCQWYILSFVAFYFVVTSVQETVLGIIFINHVIVPVQHCHNNPINTITLSSILCGFIVIIQDTPLYFFLMCKHQYIDLWGALSYLLWIHTHDHLIFLCHPVICNLVKYTSTLLFLFFSANI